MSDYAELRRAIEAVGDDERISMPSARLKGILAELDALREDARRMREAIRVHNESCQHVCDARKKQGTSYCPMLGRDRDCGDCPKDWTIDGIDAAIHPGKDEDSGVKP